MTGNSLTLTFVSGFVFWASLPWPDHSCGMEHCTLGDLIYGYQTFITGFAALAVGYASFAVARKSTDSQIRAMHETTDRQIQENRRLQQEELAAARQDMERQITSEIQRRTRVQDLAIEQTAHAMFVLSQSLAEMKQWSKHAMEYPAPSRISEPTLFVVQQVDRSLENAFNTCVGNDDAKSGALRDLIADINLDMRRVRAAIAIARNGGETPARFGEMCDECENEINALRERLLDVLKSGRDHVGEMYQEQMAYNAAAEEERRNQSN